MKVSTIVSILALAAPMIVTAKPERKRVFKIYTPEEIQSFEDNTYDDGERMLQGKEDKPQKTKPPKDQKPDEIEAPAEASMSMEMTSAPSVSAVETSAPTVDAAGTDAPVAAVVTDPPVAAIVTPAPTEPPVVITPSPTEPPVTKPPVGSFTFEPTAAQGTATEPPNPFAAAGNAPDASSNSAITVGTTLAAAAIALFVIIA